jgi:hypothetical protein
MSERHRNSIKHNEITSVLTKYNDKSMEEGHK